jgi:hypothetical protein
VRRNRKWVKHWRVKLFRLAETIDLEHPDSFRRIQALDTAMLEVSIMSLLAYCEPADLQTLLVAVLHDIVASEDDPRHWRSKESEKLRKAFFRQSAPPQAPALSRRHRLH